MFGVDKGDQHRVTGGGFAQKAHYKKWYKKAFMAILDCMLLNTYVAWNMSVDDRRVRQLGRQKVSRHELYWSIAQSLLDFCLLLLSSNLPRQCVGLSAYNHNVGSNRYLLKVQKGFSFVCLT